ncbi:DUF2510 domain-containing protein [Glaciibacter sp. 2TAF33]|uniref:DUF2510 domain-containing protein n=1 Tax=Glaciibacter sp. 2TAF33 TaxID=3233015 RepID=UPI003F8D9315
MNDRPADVAPAGWYVDPKTSLHLRWWSGEEWTGHIAPLPDADHAPVDSSRDVPPTTGTVTTTAPPLPTPVARVARVAPVEAGGMPAAPDDVSEYRTGPGSWSTASVWLIAFTPWLTLLALAAALLMYAWGVREWLQYAAISVPWLFTVACAQRDVQRLHSWGHAAVASGAWSLLGAPVYLIARTVVLYRHTGVGAPPLWMWLANLLAVAGTCLLLYIALGPEFVTEVPA